MSKKFMIVRMNRRGYENGGCDIHAFVVEGWERLAEAIVTAKEEGLSIIEHERLADECDLKLLSSKYGTFVFAELA
jgi:hypothetical protein